MTAKDYINSEQFAYDSPAVQKANLQKLSEKFAALHDDQQTAALAELTSRRQVAKPTPAPQSAPIMTPQPGGPSWWDRPLIDAPGNEGKAETAVGGTFMGMQDVAEGFTTPKNAGILLGTIGASLIPYVGPYLALAGSAYFTAEGAVNALGGAAQTAELYKKGEYGEAARAGVSSVAGLGMAGLAGRHSVKSVRKIFPGSKPTTPPKGGGDGPEVTKGVPEDFNDTGWNLNQPRPTPEAIVKPGFDPAEARSMMELQQPKSLNAGLPKPDPALYEANKANLAAGLERIYNISQQLDKAKIAGNAEQIKALEGELNLEISKIKSNAAIPEPKVPTGTGKALSQQQDSRTPSWKKPLAAQEAPQAIPQPTRITIKDSSTGRELFAKQAWEKALNKEELTPAEQALIERELLEPAKPAAKEAKTQKSKEAPDELQQLKRTLNIYETERRANKLVDEPAAPTKAAKPVKPAAGPEAAVEAEMEAQAKVAKKATKVATKEKPKAAEKEPESKTTTSVLTQDNKRWKIVRENGKEVSRTVIGEDEQVSKPVGPEKTSAQLRASKDEMPFRTRIAMSPDEYLTMDNPYNKHVVGVKNPEPNLVRGKEITDQIIEKGKELARIAKAGKRVLLAPEREYYEKHKHTYTPDEQAIYEDYHRVHDQIQELRGQLEDVSEGKVRPFERLLEKEFTNNDRYTAKEIKQKQARLKLLEERLNEYIKGIHENNSLTAIQKQQLINDPAINKDALNYHALKLQLEYKGKGKLSDAAAMQRVLREGWRANKMPWKEDQPITKMPIKLSESLEDFELRDYDTAGAEAAEIAAYKKALPLARQLAKEDRGIGTRLESIARQHREIETKRAALEKAKADITPEAEAAAVDKFKEVLTKNNMQASDSRWNNILARAREIKEINKATPGSPERKALIEQFESKYNEAFVGHQDMLAFIKKTFKVGSPIAEIVKNPKLSEAEKVAKIEELKAADELFDTNVRKLLLDEATGALPEYAKRFGLDKTKEAALQRAQETLKWSLFSRPTADGGKTRSLSDLVEQRMKNRKQETSTVEREAEIAKAEAAKNKSTPQKISDAKDAQGMFNSEDPAIKEAGRKGLAPYLSENPDSVELAVRKQLSVEDPRWDSPEGLRTLRAEILKKWKASDVVDNIMGPIERLQKSFNETDAKIVKEGLEELSSHNAADVLISKASKLGLNDLGAIERLAKVTGGKTEYDLTTQEIRRIESLASKDAKIKGLWTKVQSVLERAVKTGNYSKALAKDIKTLRKAIGESETTPTETKTTATIPEQKASKEVDAHVDLFNKLQKIEPSVDDGSISTAAINAAKKDTVTLGNLDDALAESVAKSLKLSVEDFYTRVRTVRTKLAELSSVGRSGGSGTEAPFQKTPQPKSPKATTTSSPILEPANQQAAVRFIKSVEDLKGIHKRVSQIAKSAIDPEMRDRAKTAKLMLDPAAYEKLSTSAAKDQHLKKLELELEEVNEILSAETSKTRQALTDAHDLMEEYSTGKRSGFFAPLEIVSKYGEAALHALGSKNKDFKAWRKTLERNLGPGLFKTIPPDQLNLLYSDSVNARNKVVPMLRGQIDTNRAQMKVKSLVKTFEAATRNPQALPEDFFAQDHQLNSIKAISGDPGVQAFLMESVKDLPLADKLNINSIMRAAQDISLEHIKTTSRLTPQEVAATAAHSVALTDRIVQRTKKMAVDFDTYGKHSAADQLANLEDLASLELYEAALANNVIRSGQILRVAQELRKARLSDQALTSRDLISILRKHGWEGPELMKKLEYLAKIEDPIEQFRYLKMARKMDTRDIVSWFIHTNLMSGPKTLIKNLVGTGSHIVFDVASVPFGAAFDAVFKSSNRSLYLNEFQWRAKGLNASWRESWSAAMDIWKNGFSPEHVTQMDFGIKELTPVDLVRWSRRHLPKSIKPSEYAEIWGEAISGSNTNLVRGMNAIYRIMGATDAGLKVFAYNQARYGAAFSKARSLTPKPTPELVAKFLNDPNIQKFAKGQADYLMYHEVPGRVAQKLIELKASIPPNQLPYIDLFGLPFIKTLSNIMKASVRATPIGFLKASKLTGREAAVANARAALGSAILLPVVMMATQGLITGSGPSDINKRVTLQKQGVQPNSIFLPISDTEAEALTKMGVSVTPYQDGYWVDYKMAQPVNFLLAAIGNAADFAIYDGKPLDQDLPWKLAIRAASALYDQSYLTGLNTLVRAATDTEKFGEGYVANFFRQLIPASGLTASMQEAFDEPRRHPNTIWERLTPTIAGVERPLPQIGIDGELMIKPMAGPLRSINPIEFNRQQADPISSALIASDYWPGSPVKQVTLADGRDLTPDEKVYIAQLNGRWRWKAWGRLVQAPGFTDLPPQLRKGLLQKSAAQATQWIGELAHLLPITPILPDAQKLEWLETYHAASHKLLRPWMIGDKQQEVLKEETFKSPQLTMRRLLELSYQAAKEADEKIGVSRTSPQRFR